MDKQDMLRLLVTIVDRGKGQGAVALLQKYGSLFHTILLGRGTAKRELMDYLGLGETEKDVVFSSLYGPQTAHAMKRLASRLRMDMPGGGIAFTIAVTSVGGAKTLAYLKGGMDKAAPKLKEEEPMDNHAHSLIVTIVNRGFTDQVMDAASRAGARGGTVLHARGAGQEEAATFFGITIQPEKEVVMILVRRDQKQAVMQAIAKEAGLSAPGHGLSFSLPVDQVEGAARMILEEEAAEGGETAE